MRLRLILLTYIFIFTCLIGFTQPELKIIGRITSADGLLTDGIKYTYKDSQGFMWFTFERGFQRWDGNEVKNYTYITDTSLNNSYRFCRPILEDKKGNFFIGTLHNGLIKLDRKTDTYTRYQHDTKDPENSMLGYGAIELLLDTDGMIWLGMFEGLTRFDPEAETFKNFVVNPEIKYDPRNITRSLFRDSQGILWVGTANGLYRLNEENDSLEQIITDPMLPEHMNAFECMLEDMDGNMWFGTLWGIFKYNRETQEWLHIDTGNPDKLDSKADADINCMAEFHNSERHEIWIGTLAGLKVFDIKRNQLTHFTPKNGYHIITNAGSVQYLYLDENNILWASLGGITLIDLNDNPFDIYHVYSYPDSSYQTPAYSYYEDNEGDLWIGTKAEGLYHFDQKLNFIDQYMPCSWNPMESDVRYNNMIAYIYEDPYGRVWMKTGPTDLAIFDFKERRFHPVDIHLTEYYPGQLLIDPFGVMWIASHTGLYIGEMSDDYAIDTTLYKNPSLHLNPIDGLLYDSHDRFWVLTRGEGIFCLPVENRDSMIFIRYLHQLYRHSFTIEYNARSMIEDDWGNIWFRSEKEIFRYDPELDSIVPEPYFNRNFKDNIYSLSRDKNGLLWIGINVGLVTYNPDDTINNGLRIMDWRSGMPFTFVERASFFRDSRGYMYLGGSMTTDRGLFRFHPDSIPGPNITPPPIVLTKFSVKNRDYLLDPQLTVISILFDGEIDLF